MITKTITIALTLVAFFACTSETRSQVANEGKAIVYFYSLAASTTMGRVKKPVFLDDKEIAEIRPEHFFIVLVEPGSHVFRLKNKKFGGVEMDFQAGKIYYLRMGWATNGVLKPTGITLVAAESGAYDVKQLEPVGKENIKDTKIVFTTLSN